MFREPSVTVPVPVHRLRTVRHVHISHGVRYSVVGSFFVITSPSMSIMKDITFPPQSGRDMSVEKKKPLHTKPKQAGGFPTFLGFICNGLSAKLPSVPGSI